MITLFFCVRWTCVCVCVCVFSLPGSGWAQVAFLLTELFFVSVQEFEADVDPPSVPQWSGRYVFAQLFTLTPQFIPVNHTSSRGSRASASSGKSGMCLVLVEGGELLWNRSTVNCFTSFISLSSSPFSPALYWHRGSNAGRVSSEFVLLCVFGLLLVVWRCLYDKVSYSSSLSHYYAHSLWSEHTSRT